MLFPWWRRDASVLAAMIALAAVAFSLAYFYTRSYQRHEDALARKWFQTGESDLTAGSPKQAVDDLRTALLYKPESPDYRLRLAQALSAAGQTNQAIAYFLNLWEGQPGNGLYNLELARQYARTNETRLAVQHYNAAIYGAWDNDPAEERRRARLEYIDFLLSHNSPTQAQAEAITLQAGVLPHDIPNRFIAADVLFKTGEYDRAFDEYRNLLRNDAVRANLGAGLAAFQLGWFQSAVRYLSASKVNDSAANFRLDQAKQVLAADPSQRRLAPEERARRVQSAYERAGQRLQQCASIQRQPVDLPVPITQFQKLYQEWSVNGPVKDLNDLARDPDHRDILMDLVGRIEQITARACGTPAGPDWALLMLARYGEGVEH